MGAAWEELDHTTAAVLVTAGAPRGTGLIGIGVGGHGLTALSSVISITAAINLPTSAFAASLVLCNLGTVIGANSNESERSLTTSGGCR